MARPRAILTPELAEERKRRHSETRDAYNAVTERIALRYHIPTYGQHKELWEEEARERGISVSVMVLIAVEEYLARTGRLATGAYFDRIRRANMEAKKRPIVEE